MFGHGISRISFRIIMLQVKDFLKSTLGYWLNSSHNSTKVIKMTEPMELTMGVGLE